MPIKQYRNNVLIFNGNIKAWNTQNVNSSVLMNWGHFRKNPYTDSTDSDFLPGDIITTQEQEDSIHAIGSDLFNSTPTDGWYVSGIETNKEKGSLLEFIEKEGKWFNYIKGIDQTVINEQTQDYSHFNFEASSIQGIGVLKQTITADNAQDYKDATATTQSTSFIVTMGWDWLNNIMTFDNPVNTSLQIGDTIYYQNASNTTTLGGFDTINPNEIVKFGQVTEITSNTVTIDETVFGGGNIPDPTHGAFILFVKNQVINTSSLLGYYADVKFENNSKTKVELFSVGSEISESSK